MSHARTVVLRPADREAIEIVADDNLLPPIESRLRGSGADRPLQIDLPRDVRVEPHTPAVVTIDYVRLEALDVDGAGLVGGKALKEAKLEAAIGGSGTIDLAELDADHLVVAIGGSGVFPPTAGRAGWRSASPAAATAPPSDWSPTTSPAASRGAVPRHHASTRRRDLTRFGRGQRRRPLHRRGGAAGVDLRPGPI